MKGASYDIGKSRFAFGSTPVRQEDSGLVRWVGSDGVVAIDTTGAELGLLNGGAPEAALPDWSNDDALLSTHVRDYFAAMGVAACQIMNLQVNGGSGGRTIVLARGVDTIPVAESNAYARFDTANQSTNEALYWPQIFGEVVTAARAWRDRLADPAGLAAYKALLPPEAQGDGQLLIHHTSAASMQPFAAAATYDVLEGGGVLGMPSIHSFDASGAEVITNW